MGQTPAELMWLAGRGAELMGTGIKGSIVRQSRREYRDAHAEPSRALQLCRTELGRVMQPVAIIGSIVNALAKGVPVAIDFDGLIRFLPSQSLSSAEMSTKLVSDRVAPWLCDEIITIGNQFYHCSELTKDYFRHAFGAQLGLEPVAHAWRRLAESCLVLDGMLAQALAENDTAAKDAVPLEQTALLKAVREGLSPCVDERGIVIVAGWAERRAQQRIADAEIPVEICAGGEWWPATILDISAHGVGLSGAKSIPVGEVISIAFATGVSVLCTIRWSMDHRFGVSFSDSLQSTLLDALKLQLPLADFPSAAEQGRIGYALEGFSRGACAEQATT